MNIDIFLVLFLGDLNQYVTNFQWDVAKYPLIKQTTLRNIAEIISKVFLWLKMLKKNSYVCDNSVSFLEPVTLLVKEIASSEMRLMTIVFVKFTLNVFKCS